MKGNEETMKKILTAQQRKHKAEYMKSYWERRKANRILANGNGTESEHTHKAKLTLLTDDDGTPLLVLDKENRRVYFVDDPVPLRNGKK
jgi:proteasome lid subunit RPN8/RPN11